MRCNWSLSNILKPNIPRTLKFGYIWEDIKCVPSFRHVKSEVFRIPTCSYRDFTVVHAEIYDCIPTVPLYSQNLLRHDELAIFNSRFLS